MPLSETGCGNGIFILKTNSPANDGTFEYRFMVTTMEDFNMMWWNEVLNDYDTDIDNIIENARVKYADSTVYTDEGEVSTAAQDAYAEVVQAGNSCPNGIQIHPFDRVF